MTLFEEFALETIGKIETGKDGLYEGRTWVLAQFTTEVICSDDEQTRNLPWEDQKKMIAKKFFRFFPYLK